MLTEQSFWSRVDQRGESDCWLWRGKKNTGGYGQVYVGGGRLNGQCRVTHRVAWEFAYGSIPPGLFVCHHCDNKPCVNPGHLFLGSMSDNLKDAASKGRVGAQRHPHLYHDSLKRATAASLAKRLIKPWRSPGRTGQPHSTETRKKISDARKAFIDRKRATIA